MFCNILSFLNKSGKREQELKDLLKQILKQQKIIMATQAEVAAELKAASESLDAVALGVEKVGQETQGLLTKIKELEDLINTGAATQILVDAVAAVKQSASKVADAVKAVDEKVPD